jgi:transcriptional regulator with XRE-family HTH domain
MAHGDDVGERIAQALKAAGMRPVELARRLKVSQPTVHGWINHLHGITWENVRAVAGVLKVSPGWLMFGADEEAERVAQTAIELAFLRLIREISDSDQAAVLRLVTAMQHPTPGQKPPPQTHGSADRKTRDCTLVTPLRRSGGRK